MKILVVGGGGREHALAWKLAQSPRCEALYATRPNAGLAQLAETVDVAPSDVDGLLACAHEAGIDLTVVGPEAPLVAGLVDAFEEAGLRAWGPKAAAARLEGSKAFAKEIMTEAGIPTAAYETFTDAEAAASWIRDFGRQVVVKADGLAAGKGVVMCRTAQQAVEAARRMLEEGQFGAAGARVVVEELLEGEEASFIALCDGEHVVPLASSQDHKRIGEGDTGLNTGGMGAYSPAPVVTDAVVDDVMARVMRPAVATMARRGTPFVGFLYAGLMIAPDGTPKVLEFNARLGDPETQALLVRLKSDLVDLLEAGLDGRLDQVELMWDPRPSMCVVMASEGYPVSSRKGDPIEGLAAAGAVEDVVVFHAGTRRDGDAVVVDGGRVLGVTALGDDLGAAARRVYEAVDRIRWPGMQVRRDIGWRALAR